MTKRISPHLDAARRGDWLRHRRDSDLDTPLGELLGECRLTNEEILELVCADILARTRPARPVDLAAYFADFPALADDPESVLDIIDADICARREHQLAINSSDYHQRFPELAARIARLIEIDTLETSLDDGTDFSFDQPHGPAGTTGPTAQANPAAASGGPSTGDFARYCSVELPADVRITGLLAWRDEVTCLRGSSADNRGVVIKVVSKRRLPNESLSAAIGDDLERLARVSHPAWITPDVIAENATQLVMVRPWVAGTLLTNRYLQNSPPTVGEPPPTPLLGLSPLLRELADLGYAIAAVHSQGLAHGSLHPHNLLRDHDGAIRIVDAGFGFPDPGIQWDWRLPAAPSIGGDGHHRSPGQDHAGQGRDAASLVRIVAGALIPYARACETSIDTPLQRWVRWCQDSGRAMRPDGDVSQIADNLLALADGRPLKLPASTASGRSSWWSKRFGRRS